jgi:hypothetical protein
MKVDKNYTKGLSPKVAARRAAAIKARRKRERETGVEDYSDLPGDAEMKKKKKPESKHTKAFRKRYGKRG